MGAIIVLVYVLTVLASIFFAFYVYLCNRKSNINRLFSLYTISTAGWILTLFLFYYSPENTILLVGRLNFAFVEIISYTGFYFGYWFPQKSFTFNKKIHYGLAVWTVFLLYLTIFTGLIDKNELITENGIKTEFGSLYFLFILHFLFFILSIFILPLFKLSRSSNKQKMQITYFGLGAFLSILIGGVFNIFLPFVFHEYDLQYFAPGGLLFFYGFTAYSIIKHQLFDLRVIIQRGIIYSISLSIITGFYIFILFSLGLFYEQYSSERILLSAVITTILGIYSVPIIEKYFRKITNKIFFKDKYDYSEAIFELSEILNKNLNLEDLLNKTAEKLFEILKFKEINILFPYDNLIYDKDKGLIEMQEKIPGAIIKGIENMNNPVVSRIEVSDMVSRAKKTSLDKYSIIKQAEYFYIKYKLELTVQIILEKKLIGIITLGEKLSGDLYSGEDINLLKTLSYQAGVALERAQLFERVKNYSLELENKVEQRTAKIKGLQEEQKKMMLEIAHGLQTPLTIIKGELSMLNEKIEDVKKIKAVENSIDRISKFIYDMLRIARIENEDRQSKMQMINFSQILIDLIESLEIITEAKGIKIIHKISPDIFINGNTHELEELVTNLTSNSVKYIGNGKKKEINIELSKDSKEIILTVADTGIGVSEKDLPNLFKRFYRVEGENQATNQGTGLGLAICQKIAEKHNGKIKVQSRINQGTKFIVSFPL